MQVSIRWKRHSGVIHPEGTPAAGMVSLISPMALMAAILGLWKINADIGIARSLAASGIEFSHRAGWLLLYVVAAADIVIVAVAVRAMLSRIGNPGDKRPDRQLEATPDTGVMSGREFSARP